MAVLRFGAVLFGLVALSCGRGSGQPASGRLAPWMPAKHLRGVFDLTEPRADGAIVAAVRGRLMALAPGGRALAFASAYAAPAGVETYIALAGDGAGSAACRFPAATVYALRVRGGNGVEAISPSGRVRRFVTLPSPGFEDGIAFDTSGRFGHRLLVTATHRGRAAVYAIDCPGRVQTITHTAPPVEGGIAVAPLGFGRFGGQLVAPDEHNGNIYAISASGKTTLLAHSSLPNGGDIGVESLGFLPARFSHALVADRGTPGNPHPGDNAVLSLTHSALAAAGAKPGELLAVAEASALTIAVRCATRCTVRRIAAGPHPAHIEGHVVFSSARAVP